LRPPRPSNHFRFPAVYLPGHPVLALGLFSVLRIIISE
jgi:hypothetical protein